MEALQASLVQVPVLLLPDLWKPSQAESDASDFGVGEVLMQVGKVIAYCGKT